jgi:AAA+ superfamily predicted ATPase/ubiquinone biosynthesis protein UbiJ
MLPHKYFFVIVIVVIINIFNIQTAFPMQNQAQKSAQPAQQPTEQLASLAVQLTKLKAQLDNLTTGETVADERYKAVKSASDTSARQINEANSVAAQALGNTVKALTDTIEARARIEELKTRTDLIQGELAKVANASENFAREAEHVTAKNKTDFSAHVAGERTKIERVMEEKVELIEKVLDNVFEKNKESPEDKIKTAEAAAKIIGDISADTQLKVADKAAKAHLDGIDKEYEKKHNLIRDNIPKIAVAIIVTALCIYIIKYGLPVLINYLTQPRVISETSRPGLFEWFKAKPAVDIDDLIFTPSLQKQLLDLLLRVQTAKKFNEVLPNVLFYGLPGTGKTAFVKALAYSSGLDYALTSGSEFAKITDLNHANNELRKLLNWAKRSKNGLIVFIDEAESLFANRRLPTTSKATQDFINTFLSLVSEQSQKKVMFIFATNHPFKLDDAITNRVGINIEFTLPEAVEREKILSMYLVKTAQKNEEAEVDLHPDLIKMLPKYAENLKGFSPRAIKFVAEEMIINARRQESMQLTNDIALAVMDQAKHSLQQTAQWEKEREEWTGGLNVVHA